MTIYETLIACKVYIEVTRPLLEEGVGLLTDPLPKTTEADQILAAVNTALSTEGLPHD